MTNYGLKNYESKIGLNELQVNKAENYISEKRNLFDLDRLFEEKRRHSGEFGG